MVAVYQELAWVLVGSSWLGAILYKKYATRHLVGIYQALLAMGLAVGVGVVFLNNYRSTENFYNELDLAEPWAKGYVVVGNVISQRGQVGNYYEMILTLDVIGKEQRLKGCRVLYKDEASLTKKRRFKLKIKGDASAWQDVITATTWGSYLLIKPYYYLSAKNVKSPNYQNYLYHQQRIGTFYAHADHLQLIKTYPYLDIATRIQTYVIQKIERYVTLPSYASWAHPKPAPALHRAAEIPASIAVDSAAVTPSPAALSLALLTGERRWLPDSITEQFRQTGTYHVLAISGMHTGVLIMLFYYLLRLFPLRKRWARGIIILGLLPLYLLLVGPRVSVLRSVGMVMVGFFWTLRDHTLPLAVTWAQLLLVMVMLNPHYAYDISFQLSFSAVWGVIMGLRLMQIYRMRPARLPFAVHPVIRSVSNWGITILIISASCQALTTPFVFYYFDDVNTLAPLYNLIIPPLVMITLVGSMVLVCLPFPFLSTVLGIGVAQLNEAILRILQALTTFDPHLRLTFPSLLGDPKDHYDVLKLLLLIIALYSLLLYSLAYVKYSLQKSKI